MPRRWRLTAWSMLLLPARPNSWKVNSPKRAPAAPRRARAGGRGGSARAPHAAVDRRQRAAKRVLTWMRKALIAAVLIAASMAAPPAATAETLRFGSDLAGWSVVQFPGIAPAHFAATDDATLSIATDRAAGILWHPLSGTTQHARTARWRWRVDEGVAPTDLTRRGADDRAIGIYFVFSDRPEPATGPLETLASSPVTALVSVFGGGRPGGTGIASPHMGA